MSLRAMTWAWTQDTLSSGERLVLLALADHAGEDGECWPQTARLAEKCALDRKTVQRHLIALHERGVVTKLFRRKRMDGRLAGWQYRLNMDAVEGSWEARQEGSSTPPLEGSLAFPQEGSPTPPLEPSVKNRQVEPSDRTSVTFDAWWDAYPRKTGKAAAVKTWARMTITDREAAASILPEHVAYWERERTPKHFIPHPATWLNGRRWEDELPEQERNGKSAPGMDMVRRLLEEARSNGQ